MSDATTPGVAAPADKPTIHTYARDDASLFAHVHQGDQLCTIFARSLDDLKRRVVSVLVSEFGYAQPDAQATADEHGLKPGPSADDLAAAMAYADRLQGELDAAHAQIATLEAAASKPAPAAPAPAAATPAPPVPPAAPVPPVPLVPPA